MKPLHSFEVSQFLERFASFCDAELTSLEILSPTTLKLTLQTQDKQRAFDWISLELLFEEVQDAKLVEERQLHLVDMQEGLSLLFQDGTFYCFHGKYNIQNGTKNALCYIISKSLKFQELEANL
jgi:hypothetical protein